MAKSSANGGIIFGVDVLCFDRFTGELCWFDDAIAGPETTELDLGVRPSCGDLLSPKIGQNDDHQRQHFNLDNPIRF